MEIRDLFGLSGKNVAITGSASGMSRAATEMLISLGANVYAVDIADIDLPVTAAFKADIYRLRPWAKLFVESDDRQAREIHAITRRPVYSVETNKMYE